MLKGGGWSCTLMLQITKRKRLTFRGGASWVVRWRCTWRSLHAYGLRGFLPYKIDNMARKIRVYNCILIWIAAVRLIARMCILTTPNLSQLNTQKPNVDGCRCGRLLFRSYKLYFTEPFSKISSWNSAKTPCGKVCSVRMLMRQMR